MSNNKTPFTVCLTFDLEMNSNFPYWTSYWDDKKGAIDTDTKKYVQSMNAVASEFDALLHYFIVGSALEDENLDYLHETVAGGHGIGNHTYSHCNIKAKSYEDVQQIYRQGLVNPESRVPNEVKRWEIQRTNSLIKDKLHAEVSTFRSPGGFDNGLHDVPDIRDILSEEGFSLVSSRYISYLAEDSSPTAEELGDCFRKSVDTLKPYRYPDGLIEAPLAGMTDVEAFRLQKVDLGYFLEATRVGINTAYENGIFFTNTCHPSVLASMDPHLRWLRLVFEEASKKPGGARFITINQLRDELEQQDLPVIESVQESGVIHKYPGM